MSRLPLKAEQQPTLTDNRLDNPYGQVQRFQDGALLDMGFQIPQDVLAVVRRPANVIGV